MVWEQSIEIIVDFRRTRNKPNTVSILGEEVEVMEDYRYLGVYLDNRTDYILSINNCLWLITIRKMIMIILQYKYIQYNISFGLMKNLIISFNLNWHLVKKMPFKLRSDDFKELTCNFKSL